jgi:hypothetical protein
MMKKNIFSFFGKKNKEPVVFPPVDESAEICSIVLSPAPEEEILEEEKPVELPQAPKIDCGGVSGADLKRQLRMGKISKHDMYKLTNQKK